MVSSVLRRVSEGLGWFAFVAAMAWTASGCSLDTAPAPGSGYEVGGDGDRGDGLPGEDGGQPVLDAALDAASGDGDGDGDGQVDAGPVVTDAGPDAEMPTPRYEDPCNRDADCAADERCVESQGLLTHFSYCAQGCVDDADCDDGPADGNQPECAGSGGDRHCRIPCETLIDEGCPSGMQCQDVFLFFSGGSCVYAD